MLFVNKWNYQNIIGGRDDYPLAGEFGDYFEIAEPKSGHDVKYYTVKHFNKDGNIIRELLFTQYGPSAPVNVFSADGFNTTHITYLEVKEGGPLNELTAMSMKVVTAIPNQSVESKTKNVSALTETSNFSAKWYCNGKNPNYNPNS